MKRKTIQLLLMGALLMPLLLKAQTKKTPPAKKQITSTGNKNVVAASITRGKAVYASTCLSCHQADGSGVPNLNPPLIKTKWVRGSKSVLIEQVLKGSKGKVEIDGETFHNTMPALPQLTNEQIADVLTYVRNSFGNKFGMVTTTEVKAQRAKTK